jgi:hypothetical protein
MLRDAKDAYATTLVAKKSIKEKFIAYELPKILQMIDTELERRKTWEE